MTIATCHDWKNTSMPAAHATVDLVRNYSLREFNSICRGIIPEQMEDKWFVFYTSPWLHVHRSWSGFCIYEVRFNEGQNGASIAEVRINMDPAQHAGGSDPTLLGILLDSWAGRDSRQAMIDWIKSRNHGGGS